MVYNYSSSNHIKSDGLLSQHRHPFSTYVRGVDTMSDDTPTQPETKEIPLSQGKVAIVDATDYEWLSQWKWHAQERQGRWYAVRTPRLPSGKKTTIRMHREILGISDCKTVIDHKDHDGLNNTRENIRVTSGSQNQQNTRLRTDNTTGFKGVYFVANRGRWEAHIHINKRRVGLGFFKTPEEAAKAYDKAAREHFGEFAHTNAEIAKAIANP